MSVKFDACRDEIISGKWWSVVVDGDGNWVGGGKGVMGFKLGEAGGDGRFVDLLGYWWGGGDGRFIDLLGYWCL